MGWPDATADMRAFYPTQLLETGLDILFFWVARMVMMGLELTNQLPFRTVYLHAMVRDKQGKKMSKSLGNVIDPLDMVYGVTLEALQQKLREGNLQDSEVERASKLQQEQFPDGIAECGADALRFGLLSYTLQGHDINLDPLRIVVFRQFCNKMWNTMRFALLSFSADFVPPADEALASAVAARTLTLPDQWVLSRLARAVRAVNHGFRCYEFAACTSSFHAFWLYDLCDVYLELLKPVMRAGGEVRATAEIVLYTCLNVGLRLAHPLLPFLTEELYHRLPGRDWRTLGSIMVARYPRATDTPWLSDAAEADMRLLQEVGAASRSQRSMLNMKTSKRVPLYVLVTGDGDTARTLHEHRSTLTTLAMATEVMVLTDSKVPEGCISQPISPTISVALPVDAELAEGIETEILRTEGMLTRTRASLIAERRTLASPAFTKAPAAVQEKARQNEAKLAAEVKEGDDRVAMFESLLNDAQRSTLNEKRLAREAENAANAAKKKRAKDADNPPQKRVDVVQPTTV